MCTEDTSPVVIRLRGLPFSAKEAEIKSFLADVSPKEIRFRYGSDGKITGEAFVVVADKKEADRVMAHNKELIGRRFIETIPSSIEEMNWCNRKAPKPDGTLRLYGLPYSITKDEIRNFFEGLEIVENGIGILTDSQSRPTGEAFVQFTSPKVANLGLEKHMERIGSRYVEIYESNLTEANQAIRRQMHINLGNRESRKRSYHWANPYWSNTPNSQDDSSALPNSQELCAQPAPVESGQTLLGGQPFAKAVLTAAGLAHACPSYQPVLTPTRVYPAYPNSMPHCSQASEYSTVAPSLNQPSNSQLRVRMRGLPFSATEANIMGFFHPIQPVSICLRYNKVGQPLGEADVMFANVGDARKALGRDRALMGSRYVELFSTLKK
ncbi:Heterogeneous nuclear ribonucleoprotein F/H [Fasciola hepatica]|uniref:Heterogeneous nuclear ribonucleoprotein F/H n=1 Tax=Fasciola hepatica TaxID=6192 RepID=A0A4E0RYW1_FASHE|nr:Heterogeneous nuclear ribonucleoprotein F/H [Fasciola hepatica]